MERALDQQVGGNHYKGMKIQPVEFCHANQLGYAEGAIIKYVCRFRQKNGRQDLEKAKHFLDLLIQLEYGEGVEEAKAENYYRDLERKSATAVGRMP